MKLNAKDRVKILNTRLDPQMRTLLDSNREIIAKVRAMQSAPAPRDVAGKNWYRIENAAAEEAHVYIYDEIGFWGTSAQGFIDELNSITSPKLSIHVNSPGGEVFDGVAIHSALMASPAHVTVYIDGLAASAASFIAMAGDRIVMARNATMMIHDAAGLCWGNAEDMKATADLLDKLSNNIADIYALQTDGTVEEWRTKMRAETWYTGQEALAAGLVDEITQPGEPDEDEGGEGTNAAPTRMSMAAFKFANRAAAPDPIVLDELLCKCMNLDGTCPNKHAADGDDEDEEEEADLEDGETLFNSAQYQQEQRMAFLAAALRS